MDEKLYTVQDLEKIFKVTRQAICAWIRRDGLVASKVGKFWRIKESDLLKFLEDNKRK